MQEENQEFNDFVNCQLSIVINSNVSVKNAIKLDCI